MANNSAVSLPDYTKVYQQMQKDANATAIKVQQMADATTAKTFEFNASEASKARTWQNNMSKTAHQREVKDLVAAGLNPVLSAGGNGAQSYTTSSASGEAENPANAVAQLEAAKMSNLSSMYGSNIQAEATRRAAQTSALATMSAAQTQADAQRYASDQNYKLGVYKAGLDYEAKKMQAEAQRYAADRAYQAVIDRPASNPWALADKYLTKSGVGDKVANAIGSIANKIIDNSSSMFVGKKATKDHFNLDKQGIIQAQSGLKKLNIPDSGANRTLFVKATVFGDNDAYHELSRMTQYYNGKDSRGKPYTSYGKYNSNAVYDFDI